MVNLTFGVLKWGLCIYFDVKLLKPILEVETSEGGERKERERERGGERKGEEREGRGEERKSESIWRAEAA
ncbi:MAG: hypothetical protein ACTS4U_01195 [Candidatus Hodgkinia cicadicola]